MRKPTLSELTIDEKIGQMLLGFPEEMNRKTELDHEILRTQDEKKAIFEKEKFGSLWALTGSHHRGTPVEENPEKSHILGGRVLDGSKEYGEWISAQAEWLKIPPLTALDAEQGGGTLFYDLSVASTPFATSATNDENLAFEMGAAIARELRCAGVTWRWGPTVDITNRFNLSFMRSYAPFDTDKQIRFSIAHAKGMQSEGVAATAKHFPGNDYNEYRDSHYSQTQIRSSKEKWYRDQGRIFQEMIDAGVYSVMMSHIAFPAIDDEKIKGKYVPATISKKIITDLLKDEMGFRGVVITDDLRMGGVFNLFPYDELIIRFVNAGNDVLLNVLPGTCEIIKKAVAEGKISEERIDDACQRILDMKEKIGMFEDGYNLVKGVAEEVTPKAREINMEIARRAVTLIRDRNDMLPLDKNKIKKVKVICSAHTDELIDQLEVLKEEFEKRGIKVSMQRRLESIEELKLISDENDLIIYAATLDFHAPWGMTSFYDKECITFMHAFSSGNEKSIGVSFGHCYIHYDFMENANTFINTYGRGPELMKALVEAVFGEIEFKGTCPVPVIPPVTEL